MVVYFTIVRPFTTPKCPLPVGRSAPSSNTWVLQSTQVHTANGIFIGSAIFAGCTNVSNRETHTDHTVIGVAKGCILCSVERSGLKTKKSRNEKNPKITATKSNPGGGVWTQNFTKNPHPHRVYICPCWHFTSGAYAATATEPVVGGVAQWLERRSSAGELSLSCARPAADGWLQCG